MVLPLNMKVSKSQIFSTAFVGLFVWDQRRLTQAGFLVCLFYHATGLQVLILGILPHLQPVHQVSKLQKYGLLSWPCDMASSPGWKLLTSGGWEAVDWCCLLRLNSFCTAVQGGEGAESSRGFRFSPSVRLLGCPRSTAGKVIVLYCIVIVLL